MMVVYYIYSHTGGILMHDVVAVVFDGKKTAQKALDTLEEETTYAERQWVDHVAVLSRSKNGFIRVNSTWAESDDEVAVGAGFGAITGALIGATAGPGGALAGALGGGTLAGLFGASLGVAISDDRLEEFAGRLKDDTSALILVADEPTVDDFRSAFEPITGEVIETKLNEHDVKALREALKAERERRA